MLVPEVSEEIIRIVQLLASRDALEPDPVVNMQFSRLVEICVRSMPDPHLVLRDPRVQSVIGGLRDLCSDGEYRLERHWARKVIGAAEPDAELAAFPYLSNYQQLTRMELHALAGAGVDLSQVRRVCFLGGGPLPLSALFIGRDLFVPVDVVDISAEATQLGCAVAQRLSIPSRITFHHGDAAQFGDAGQSDVVILAALVGTDPAVKHRLLTTLGTRMRAGSILLARSSHGLRTLLYPSLAPSDLPPRLETAGCHPPLYVGGQLGGCRYPPVTQRAFHSFAWA